MEEANLKQLFMRPGNEQHAFCLFSTLDLQFTPFQMRKHRKHFHIDGVI